jgi:chromosomal replication initiation ATPase DnaA
MGAEQPSWLEEMNRPVLALASIQSTVRGMLDRKRLSELETRVASIERRLDVGAECVAEEAPLPRLVSLVARFYHVDPARLVGRERERRFVWPRHVCWYLARTALGLTLSEIAEHFGLRSHGAVLSGVRGVKDGMSVAPTLQREVAELERLCDEELL